ncbi:MAG: hypothetical protein ACFCUH_07605 [Flavobacteriales bacterium]
MKFVTRLGFAVAALMVLVQLSGCLNEDNRIPPNCYDGVLNNLEELVDCGGPNCEPCDPCINGIWEPELGEQWVDCGGECEPCASNFNGQLDPGEECIDCGGTTGVACGELCNDGLPNGCEVELDCGGQYCPACPNCNDNILNQDEIGIDCGGSECEECPPGVNCVNGILDGDELYIDCGGENCPECEFSMRWRANNNNTEADALAQATLAGTAIQITGASTNNTGLTAILAEPAGGWVSNTTIQANAASFPDIQVIYTNSLGEVFSSQFDNSSAAFTIAYVAPIAGGVIVGTFSGNLFNGDGEQNVNISNGEFLLEIQ